MEYTKQDVLKLIHKKTNNKYEFNHQPYLRRDNKWHIKYNYTNIYGKKDTTLMKDYNGDVLVFDSLKMTTRWIISRKICLNLDI